MSVSGRTGNEGGEVIPAATDDRIREMVRRGRNLARRGLITEADLVRILAGEIRLMAAEDLVVRRETADMDTRLAELFGGAA